MTGNRPPNILCVVMDTVRAEDFPGGPRPVAPTPFLDRIQHESVLYPRAVAPASWTIPSHASLFTGLYPWDHGVHNRQDIRLALSLPTTAEILRPAGYRSAALSANFLLGPESGLSRGFDLVAWGEWWEGYLRGVRPQRPPHLFRSGDPAPVQPEQARRGRRWQVVRSMAPLLHRYPGFLDTAGRLLGRLIGRAPSSDDSGHVASWIEPALSEFVKAQTPETPVYAFVNLLEAHEPYFPTREVAPRFTDWVKYARVRQDRHGWLSKAWDPEPDSMERLRNMYRASVRSLDERIRRLVKVFEEEDRWENTLMILTSDHGQALGEHDLFFHMLQVDEAEVRVPLWVRWPHGESGGTTARGWASLVDVLPTLAEAAGVAPPVLPRTVPLDQLVNEDRRGPVFSIADGILSDPMLRGLEGERRHAFDRVWVAAYAGDWKLTLDAEQDVPHAYRIDRDAGELNDLWSPTNPTLEPLVTSARDVGRRMQGTHPAALTDETEARLRAWGYL